MQMMFLGVLLRSMPNRNRFDMRQVLSLRIFTPIGYGISNCVALGEAQEVMREIVDVLTPDVDLLNCDLVWMLASAACIRRTITFPLETCMDSDQLHPIQFNVEENTLRIVMNNGIDKETVVYKTDNFPLQRWNNILINYNGGTLDIFINGKLKSTTPNIVPVMSYDGISVGDDDGLSGGICNVVYFPNPVPLSKIQFYYKSLKYKNPPVL